MLLLIPEVEEEEEEGGAAEASIMAEAITKVKLVQQICLP